MSEHILELCAPYALSALDGDEALAVEAHCATCAQCAAELAVMRGVVSMLPLACGPAAPSRDLKRRILTAARSDAAADRLLRRSATASRPSWGAAAGLAAAAALLVGIGALADHERMAQQVALMQSRTAQADARVAATQARADESLAMVAAIARGRIWDKSGGPSTHWWHCTIVQSPKQKKAMLLAMMPPAPKGMTYQAWVIRRGAPHDAGTVPAGTTSITTMPMPLQTGDVVAFTVEPEGGSASPTMPYLMTQTL